MTLRDELAQAALIGRLGHPHWSNCQMRTAITQGGCPGGDFPPEFYAAIYRDADAMLAARGPDPVPVIGDWTYVTTSSAPPLVNEVRLNQSGANLALATAGWIWNVTLTGQDQHAALLQATGELTLQDTQTADRHLVFTVMGAPIDRGQYAELPLSAVRAGPATLQTGRVFVQFHTLFGAE